MGSSLNSSVKRRHSPTFSGETKSTATLVHDCACSNRIVGITQENLFGERRKHSGQKIKTDDVRN